MEQTFHGKVALVTGGSRGIGQATALAFARLGADVVVTSRKIEDLEKVAEEVRGLGRRSLAVAAHIGRQEQIADLVEKVKTEFGRIDILVNNAGNSPTLSSVLDVEERLWDTIMNLNLKGLFFLSQAAARLMKEQGGGKVDERTRRRQYYQYRLDKRPQAGEGYQRLQCQQSGSDNGDQGNGAGTGAVQHQGQCNRAGAYSYKNGSRPL